MRTSGVKSSQDRDGQQPQGSATVEERGAPFGRRMMKNGVERDGERIAQDRRFVGDSIGNRQALCAAWAGNSGAKPPGASRELPW